MPRVVLSLFRGVSLKLPLLNHILEKIQVQDQNWKLQTKPYHPRTEKSVKLTFQCPKKWMNRTGHVMWPRLYMGI